MVQILKFVRTKFGFKKAKNLLQFCDLVYFENKIKKAVFCLTVWLHCASY